MKNCIVLSLILLQSCTINVIVTKTIGNNDDVDPDATTETTADPDVQIPLIK